jgi:electron transfer flavoprotein beta subunit
MKILVAIKQVPDTATQIKISGSDPKAIDTAGITWIVSPYDEFAIEEALRIKEKQGQGEVVAVSLGPDRVKEALRSALAMGCDRAIHLNDPAWASADTLLTAQALAAVVKQEAPQLVLCGRQAIDDDMAAVTAQLAEFLGWPCVSWIMEEAVAADGKTARVARQFEGGLEVFDVPLPAVASAQKGLNEPRSSSPSPGSRPCRRGRRGASSRAKSRTPSKSSSARCAKTPKRSRGTTDMAGAFWCIVEDDRKGMPKKVMAEVIGEAARLAGGAVEAVWLTDKATDAGLKQLAEWGATKVWLLENPAFGTYQAETWTPVLADLVAKESPKALFGAVTSRQRELVARLAARLGTGLAADCVAFTMDGDRLVATRPIYAGKLLSKVTWAKQPWLATLRPNVFRPAEAQAGKTAAVDKPPVTVPPAMMKLAERRE